MRLAYFDCFAGITGGMALGALIDAGADLDTVAEGLQALPAGGFELEAEPVDVRGVAATRLAVRSRAGSVIRTYASIKAILEESRLPDRVRSVAGRTFNLLASADARAHARDIELTTFHEVGEVDPVAAVIGSAIALDVLGVDRVFASPVPTGLGMARTEHGMVPIPSPVVVDLLRGAPTYSRGIPAELVTPVGAALLAALAEGYGDMPLMR